MNSLLAEVVDWLVPSRWSSPPFFGRSISPGAWYRLRTVLVRQGLGPYFAGILPGSALHHAFPPEFKDWLASESLRNQQRIQRMHLNLERILAAASDSRIPVMPLKGSLLTHLVYPVSSWRPMADLDLLIFPHHLEAMTAALVALGYRQLPEKSSYARHTKFIDPLHEKVVFWDGEHPDNPSPVEIHTQIHRPYWGDVESPDLTTLLWESSTPSRLMGAPVAIPSNLALLTHLCLHATLDLLTQKARIIQFLDIALVAPSIAEWEYLLYPRITCPPLFLAARLFPHLFENINLSILSTRIPASIARHFQSVPIDERCGLVSNPVPQVHQARFRLHWDRWKPFPWRFQLVYGEIPYLAALAKHLLAACRYTLKTKIVGH